MKFEPGMVCKTRDGREVEILKTDAPGNMPIIGMFLDDEMHTGAARNWHANGAYHVTGKYETFTDLIPPKRTREVTVWVNVYPDGQQDACPDERNARDLAAYVLRSGVEPLAVAVPVTFTLGR